MRIIRILIIILTLLFVMSSVSAAPVIPAEHNYFEMQLTSEMLSPLRNLWWEYDIGDKFSDPDKDRVLELLNSISGGKVIGDNWLNTNYQPTGSRVLDSPDGLATVLTPIEFKFVPGNLLKGGTLEKTEELIAKYSKVIKVNTEPDSIYSNSPVYTVKRINIGLIFDSEDEITGSAKNNVVALHTSLVSPQNEELNDEQDIKNLFASVPPSSKPGGQSCSTSGLFEDTSTA